MPKRTIIGDTIDFDPQDSSDPRRVALSLHVGWDNGLPAGGVQLGVRAVDPETGQPVDIGGAFITLDWAATNAAIKALREGRDGSHGKPE
jgi:hypothetical protein